MHNVVSHHQVEDTRDGMSRAITEGGFGSVPILHNAGKVVGIVTADRRI